MDGSARGWLLRSAVTLQTRRSRGVLVENPSIKPQDSRDQLCCAYSTLAQSMLSRRSSADFSIFASDLTGDVPVQI